MQTDKRAHLLVVDDNEMNRDVLARRLERQNYQVSLAEDGEQALQVMRQTPFDLVLLDIMMPKMNGYEVLEHVRADPALRLVPIIVISAVDELDSVVRCIELGAEDYLFKPFNPVLLKARVNACIEKKHLREQARVADEVRDPSTLDALASSQRLLTQIVSDAQRLTASDNGMVEQIRRSAAESLELLAGLSRRLGGVADQQ